MLVLMLKVMSSPYYPPPSLTCADHCSHLLLLTYIHRVALHVGWKWIALPLSALDEMQGDLVVVLDSVGDIEQMQLLLKWCRYECRGWGGVC